MKHSEVAGRQAFGISVAVFIAIAVAILGPSFVVVAAGLELGLEC